MSLTMTERYWAARITIVFITFIFSLLGTIVLTWMVRRHRDSARWCFTFAKFIGVLFSVYCFIDLCYYVLWFAFTRLQLASRARDYVNDAVVIALFLGRVQLSALARFCDYLLIVFIFMSLITMGNGIIHSRAGSPSPKSKIIKRSADGVSLIIAALATAQLGLRIRVYLDFYLEDNNVKHGDRNMMDLLNIARQLDFASLILVLLCSVANMGRAIKIYLPTRADKKIYWPSYCLLFCSSLWLLRSSYDTVYQVRYLDLIDVNRSRDEEYYISLITVIFYILPVLTILYATLGLGMRQSKGLWSTQQPWMLYDAEGSEDIPLEPRATSLPNDPVGNPVSPETSHEPNPEASYGASHDTSHEPSREASREASHEVSNLPPAYSPPQISADPFMPQQPTAVWGASSSASTPSTTSPQGVARRPLPPLSTISVTLPVQQAPNHQPAETAAYGRNQHTPSASSGSPGSSQQPFVVEDRGPALMPQSTSPQSLAQSVARLSPTEPAIPSAPARRAVPGSSIAATRVPPPVTGGVADATRTEKSPDQPADQLTPQTSSESDGSRRYQQAPMDNAYNTGIVDPELSMDLGPTDGFYRPTEPTSPPSHDHAMGFNHQADGRAPTEALPYPEKN